MGLISIDPRDKTPIYAQLERGLRAAIATSRLRPGEQLPTVRQLAVELRVNANTGARSAESAGCRVLVVPNHVPVLPGEHRVVVDTLVGLTATTLPDTAWS